MKNDCVECSIQNCSYREAQYKLEKEEKGTSEKIIKLITEERKPISITRVMNHTDNVDIFSIYQEGNLITKKIGRNKNLPKSITYMDYTPTNFVYNYSFNSLGVKSYRYLVKTIPQGSLGYRERMVGEFIGELDLKKKMKLRTNTIMIFRGDSVFSYDEETKKTKRVGTCNPKCGKIYMFEHYLQDEITKGTFNIYNLNNQRILLVRNGNQVSTNLLNELKLKSSAFIKREGK